MLRPKFRYVAILYKRFPLIPALKNPAGGLIYVIFGRGDLGRFLPLNQALGASRRSNRSGNVVHFCGLTLSFYCAVRFLVARRPLPTIGKVGVSNFK